MLNPSRKRAGANPLPKTQPLRPVSMPMPPSSGDQPEMVLEYSQQLDVGKVRERNEDRCGVFIPATAPLRAERGLLFVVADGMGGHAAGDVAAEITVNTVGDAYFASDPSWTTPAAQMRAAFLSANAAILTAAGEGNRKGMGAAAVAVAVARGRAYVTHLGDCRAYLVHGDRVTHMTSDHSWVQERIDSGRLSLDEARSHPHRNVLTRALGADTEADPDVNEFALAPGDTMVLCSDGLWSVVEDSELARATASSTSTAAIAESLVQLALNRGGPDNISVIIVRVSAPSSEAPTVQITR